jgi:cytochrome c peroxidase
MLIVYVPALPGVHTNTLRDRDARTMGLPARAPHFHNGAARNLQELINFHNLRFQMNLTDEESDEEKEQLTAFLNSL